MLLSTILMTAAGCGDDGSSGGDTGDSGDGIGDGTGDGITPACSDGRDNDGDDLVDGQDPECTGPADDDEGSFATGIPGDNKDDKWQDCFFDGDSGAGNDGCRFHTCCLLGAESGADCAVDANFDPGRDCPAQTTKCIEFCAPLTPAGCDCFGCCTVCDPDSNQCYDVLTSPAVAPDCTLNDIDNPEVCPTCTKNTQCSGGACEPTGCTLCPGQTSDDLPESCGGQNTCPGGSPCETTSDCADGEYCSSSCCLNEVD
jgi:hypothetical protein